MNQTQNDKGPDKYQHDEGNNEAGCKLQQPCMRTADMFMNFSV